VIDQEAAKLGKSSAASTFAGHMVNQWKAGGYELCMDSLCSDSKVDFSIAGVLTLPAKTKTGIIVLKSYAYSYFVNDLHPVPSVEWMRGRKDRRRTARPGGRRSGPAGNRPGVEDLVG
jgi:hypothetical protein